MQDLHDWITQLQNSNKLIIVEGKKDKLALETLGIKNILTLNKPLFSVIELVAESYKECIILSDLDKEGKKIYSVLKKDLQRHGVKIDTVFREFLFKKTKITNIEGIKCRIL